MDIFIGITDGDWFELVSGERPPLDEVNFWQPSGRGAFRRIELGEPFLFKLHAPNNYVVGGGFFAHFSLLPVSLAWESFGRANGAATLAQMRARIEKYRRVAPDRADDYTIGCILLEQPFFFDRADWISVPFWKANVVRGAGLDVSGDPGLSVWSRVRELIAERDLGAVSMMSGVAEGPRFGSPAVVTPRLGQGSFRVLVMDAYERRCAVTRERTLPALEAAHIRPYSEGGEHAVDNGLLLRRDLHALFDRGYLTVTPELVVEVSRRIREEFENGRDYYAIHGRTLEPAHSKLYVPPSPALLRWHNENRFRG